MTPLEREIIKALQETKPGKKFVEEWDYTFDDMVWDSNCNSLYRLTLDIEIQLLPADNIVIIPSEPQMLTAIKKAGYRYMYFSDREFILCECIDSQGKKIMGIENEFRAESNSSLETIQRAFLEIVLGKEK